MLYDFTVQSVGGDAQRKLFVSCSLSHLLLFGIRVPPLFHSRLLGCTCHMMYGGEDWLGVKWRKKAGRAGQSNAANMCLLTTAKNSCTHNTPALSSLRHSTPISPTSLPHLTPTQFSPLNAQCKCFFSLSHHTTYFYENNEPLQHVRKPASILILILFFFSILFLLPLHGCLDIFGLFYKCERYPCDLCWYPLSHIHTNQMYAPWPLFNLKRNPTLITSWSFLFISALMNFISW